MPFNIMTLFLSSSTYFIATVHTCAYTHTHTHTHPVTSHIVGFTLPECACVASHSVVSDSATPWTVARQAPLSKEFSRQEHWSGLSFPPPGDLPDPEIEPASLMHWQAGFLPLALPGLYLS